MASIEYLTKRVEGKKAEIAKLEKKLARIEKAKASNWENNPYYYSESDLKWTTRDIEQAHTALADYEAKLQAEIEKAGSRDVQVIIDFLEEWKLKSRKFYDYSVPAYVKARAEYYAEDKAYCDWWNNGGRRASAEERKARRVALDKAKKQFTSEWAWIMPYVNRNKLDTAKLDKDLKREAERKYDFIIERTNAIVGQITDASNLYISDNGELNGFITGTKSTAKVQTVGAGGWNIQRYHFRTLIHEMK